MRMGWASLALAASVWLPGGCASPPPGAYVSGGLKAATISVGNNTAGDACHQTGGAGDSQAEIYCGSWLQPSARVASDARYAAQALAAIAASSPWRDGLDRRMVCTGSTGTTILGRDPAVILSCTQRNGGWPQVALVASSGGKVWLADGMAPAAPAIERSIGILSGALTPQEASSRPVSSGLEAQRLASAAFSAGDIGAYDRLMFVATRENLSGNYASAEHAYRDVVALQEKTIGHDAPGLAPTLTAQALQLSNEGEFADAERVFKRANTLMNAPGQTDPSAPARLLHYYGLHLLNQAKLPQALDKLREAERAYGAQLPPGALEAGQRPAETGRNGPGDDYDEQDLLSNTPKSIALIGVIETRRAQAVALRQLGQNEQSQMEAASAARLAQADGFNQLRMRARLTRTAAYIAEARGERQAALSGFSQSTEAFSRAYPNSRAYAETGLLWAGQLRDSGRIDEALAACRTAATVLRAAQDGTRGAYLQPCLLVLKDEAEKLPGQRQALLAEMFATAQLARSSITSQQIAQASARLTENARDPRVAALIRAREDQNASLESLYEQRDDAKSGSHPDARVVAGLDTQIAALQAKQADSERAMQAASPNYGQLVQQAVSAADVFAALHPGEAFAAVALFRDSGWTFLLRNGVISVAAVDGGAAKVAGLVQRVRASMDSDREPPPPFDIDADRALYQSVLGGVAAGLQGATSLSVAPSGPLLALPFGLLLDGPAQQDNLAGAPWLIRSLTIEHVPAPANFVSLRKLAGTSRAGEPWFGFGDFRPVTLAQAEQTYPIETCGDSARLLAGLPPLPGAQKELAAVRGILHADATDELTGAAFTQDAIAHAALKRFRVLHFATHALLPTDLRCQTESALVVSPPPGATDASGALLTASQVARLDLDADAVVLSACNTGGPAGATSGESLTGLARSFFFAGARALLVTHWAVNDRATAYLVAITLRGSADRNAGLAGALANAQRRLLREATGGNAGFGPPFYWAALAVIGEGMGEAPARVASLVDHGSIH